VSNPYAPYDPHYSEAQPPGVNEEATSIQQGGDTYLENYSQMERDARGNVVQRSESVYEDPNQRRANLWSGLYMTVYFLLGVVEAILGLRFIFRLLGASEASSFVRFLYDISYPLMHPFLGIFTDPALGHGSVFEVSTLIAMLIYALLGWGVVALIRILLAPRRASRQSSTSTWRRMR
jgi:hypothetical protein